MIINSLSLSTFCERTKVSSMLIPVFPARAFKVRHSSLLDFQNKALLISISLNWQLLVPEMSWHLQLH